jgi:hypothetical protein
MCVQSGNQNSTQPSAAGIRETDIKRMENKIINLWNIRHTVDSYHFLLFLDIEPAATTAKYTKLDTYILWEYKLSPLTKRKIIYHNASVDKPSSTPCVTVHTVQNSWNVANHIALHNVFYQIHNQQHEYIVAIASRFINRLQNLSMCHKHKIFSSPLTTQNDIRPSNHM